MAEFSVDKAQSLRELSKSMHGSLVILFMVIGGLAVLAILAGKFGVDSRQYDRRRSDW